MLAVCRAVACAGMICLISGCAMCGSCDDLTYPTYGGAWERLDPHFGRVGSAFTPDAGMRVLPDSERRIESPMEDLPAPAELPPEGSQSPDMQLDSQGSDSMLPSADQPGLGEPNSLPMGAPEEAPAPPGELPDSTDTSVLRGPIRSTR